jgi:hypothetical protein
VRARTVPLLLAAALALGACAPPPAEPAPLLEPGAAEAALAALILAAGSAQAVNFDLTGSGANLTVVVGQYAETWGWRDGAAERVTSDTAWVGQAIFDPRDFDLSDPAALFAVAAAESGSDTGQRLHLVEYADGRVLLSVTTNPESRPVFFRADGSLVATLDFTSAAGLAEGYADVTAGHPQVLQLGLDPDSGGVYAVWAAAGGGARRSLRMPQLPVHDSDWSLDPGLEPFDPALVRPAVLADLMARLPALAGLAPGETAGVSFTIDRRDGAGVPVIYLTANGQSFRSTLSGAIIPG